MKNAKVEKFKCDILSTFQTLWQRGMEMVMQKKLLIFFRFVNFEMLFIFKIRFCLEKRYVFIIRLIPLLCHTNVTDFQGYIR